jgi:type VI secretion system protein ImpA
MTITEKNHDSRSLKDIILEPIGSENPCGSNFKLDPLYDEIMKARSSDDPNLPQGEWQRDLKKADWNFVKDRTEEVLATRTKDLQLAIWLLEAKTHLNGFSGFAEGVRLIANLTDKFWDQIHPVIDDNDLEYRSNLFRWMNDKLQPVLRKIPLTRTNAQTDYSWNDWEKSSFAESSQNEIESSSNEIAKLTTIQHAISLSPNYFFDELSESILEGLSGLGLLADIIDNRFGSEAPSVQGLIDLLYQIQTNLRLQLKSRGLMSSPEDTQEIEAVEGQEDKSAASFAASELRPRLKNSITTREQAYQYLADAAAYLEKEDSHSPVPYLVYKAIDWGRLNATDLYREVFIRHEGTLNIFDLVGIDGQEKEV